MDEASVPRVYLSSTSLDLADCRAEVRDALQRMHLDGIAMESYTAQETRPHERCVADVKSADVYIGILAWRYGHIPEGQDRSITELEYEAAEEAGIPRLMFILDPDAPWPLSRVDDDRSRIIAFRGRALEAHVCDNFARPEQLRSLVGEALTKHLRTVPGSPRRADGSESAWRAYRDRLLQEHGRLNLEALTPPQRDEHLQIALREIFVEPDVREEAIEAELPKELRRRLAEEERGGHGSGERAEGLPRGLDRDFVERTRQSWRRTVSQGAFKVVTAPSARLTVLLGDPGAGKSTLAKYLALALAEERTDGPLAPLAGWQPVLIELRDFAPRLDEDDTFAAYLGHRERTDGLGVPSDVAESWFRGNGRALVIFDGLDEIFDPRLREIVSRRIAGFAAQYPKVRVLVTSRVVGYRHRLLRDAGFQHFTVQDLDEKKIDSFLDHWYGLAMRDRPVMAGQRRERITKAVKDSASIRDLAGNPLLLTILAIIGKHQELPRERWKVYEHAAEVLVQHWDVNKRIGERRPEEDPIREEDKKELLCKLAIRMQEGEHGFAGNGLLEQDLKTDINDYLTARFRLDPIKAGLTTGLMMSQLRERNFIFARYGPGYYGFVHRALLEYFAAKQIVTRFEKTRELDAGQLVDLFLERSKDSAWTEVLRLIAGMVDPAVAGTLVEKLLTADHSGRFATLDPYPPEILALAAQCIAEIRNINAAERAARLTMTALIETLRLPERSFGDDRGTHLDKAVLPAAKAVGVWPGREDFRSWYFETGRFVVEAPAGTFAARLLAAFFPRDETVRRLLFRETRAAIPRQRESALRGIVQSWKEDPETPDTVAGAIRDQDGAVRLTALDLLVTTWPEAEATRTAIMYCQGDADSAVRERAVQALSVAFSGQEAGRRAALRALTSDFQAEVRVAALRTIASTWPDADDTGHQVLRACSDPVWKVRREALRSSVARNTDDDAHRAVLRAVRDADEDVRETAVELLASRWRDHPATFPAVRQAGRDPHSTVRGTAVSLLARHWPDLADAREALDRAKGDPDADVMITALTVWVDAGRATEEYRTILQPLMTMHPEPEVRAAAWEALFAEFPDDRGWMITEGLRDSGRKVRSAALRRLMNDGPRTQDHLPLVLRLCQDEDDDIRLQALRAALRYWKQDRRVSEALRVAFHSFVAAERKVAVEASMILPEEEQKDLLRRAWLDFDGAVREMAYRMQAVVLGSIPDTLISARSDSNWAIRGWATYQLLASWLVRRPVPASMSDRAFAAVREAVLHRAVLGGVDSGDSHDAVSAALEDVDPKVRHVAFEIVAANRDRWADPVATLMKAVEDADKSVRKFGIEALQAAWPQSPETIEARMRSLADSHAPVRRAALEGQILSGLDLPETQDALSAAVGADDHLLRNISIDVLSLVHNTELETPDWIIGLARHPTTSVRNAAQYTAAAVWPMDDRTVDLLLERLSDPASWLRTSALRYLALARPAEPATISALTAAQHSGDPELERAAAALGHRPNALGEGEEGRRHPSVVHRLEAFEHVLRTGDEPALITACGLAIRDDSGELRSRGRHVLVTCVSDSVAAAVVSRTWRHFDSDVRLIDLRVRLARWPHTKKTADALHRALQDPAGYVRIEALAALIASAPTAEATREALNVALTDTYNGIRLRAVEAKSVLWTEAASRLAVPCRDPDPAVRVTALLQLVRVWPDAPETRQALVDALTDDYRTVRRVALEGLHRIGSPAPDPNPVQAERDRAREVEEFCREAPGDPVAEGILIAATSGGSCQTRIEALAALVRRGPVTPTALAALMSACADSDRSTRGSALYRLAEAVPGSDVAVTVLCEAAKDPSPMVRRDAIRLLRLWRTETSYSALAGAVRDPDADVREEALEGLVLGWPEAEVTRDALSWTSCSALDWDRGVAERRLRTRKGISSADWGRTHPELLGRFWADLPEVAAVLREQLDSSDDVVRNAALRGLLSWWADGEEREQLMWAGLADPCPAVRAAAWDGMAATGDIAGAAEMVIETDAVLRGWVRAIRAVGDRSAEMSAELLAVLRDEPEDDAAYETQWAVAVRVGAGLIDTASLAELAATHPVLDGNDTEWLQWLVNVSRPTS